MSRRVVDEQRRLVVARGRVEHALPLALVLQPALAQVVALDRRLAGDEPLRQLGLAHLEAEQRHRLRPIPVQRHVLGDVRDQRRFSHGWPGSQDDQIAGLEAARDLVEVPEAGRRAGERDPLARELLPLVDLDVEDLADLAEVLRAVVVGDLEDAALGELDEDVGLLGAVEDARLDLVGLGQQPAQQRVLAHDAPVAQRVADGRDRAGERVDLRLAARVLELPA